MKPRGIFNVKELAAYLNYLHNCLYHEDISPLKLQKVLFFLFGEWGSFVKKADENNDGFSLKKFSPYLFDEDFEAWIYGPVVRKVYNEFQNEKIEENKIFKTSDEQYVGAFIKDLAEELFQLSDFRLVELSHQMECWKNNFRQSDEYHNTIIDKDLIINEFASQV